MLTGDQQDLRNSIHKTRIFKGIKSLNSEFYMLARARTAKARFPYIKLNLSDNFSYKMQKVLQCSWQKWLNWQC